MSRMKSATRRLSLLAGASLVASSLAAFAAVLAPTAALAANECGDPTANGTTADTFVCTGAIPSITYPGTSGNLTLQLWGLLVVTGGIAVTGTTTHSITIMRPNSTVEPERGTGDPQISNSGGAAINVDRTTQGAISITLADSENSQPFLDLDDGPMTITGTTAGIRTRNIGTGATTVALGQGGTHDDDFPPEVTATNGAGLDLSTTGTGAITVNSAAVITGTTAAILVESGANVTINQGLGGTTPGGVLNGRVLLSNTGTTTFTNRGAWNFEGVSTLRSGSVAGTTTLNNFNMIATTGASAAINFGPGTSSFNQAGYLIVGDEPGASTLTLSGLDSFTNTGGIYFGQAGTLELDGETNDRIVVVNDTASTFTGGAGSLLVMDVDFSASQSSCAAAVTADCLDLRGHNTAGTSTVWVNSVRPGLTAERIVLVDVAGAGTDTGVFAVDSRSPGYRPFGDGMVDGGLFLYEITHDAAAKQHVLTVAGVDEEAVEINLAGRAGLVGWETATATFFDRQTDVRTTLRAGGGLAPGGWIKVAGNFVNRNMVSSLALAGDSIDVVTHHNQDTFAVVGGIDLVAFSDGVSAALFGLTAGQVNSELQFKGSPNGVEFDGHSFGAYASYVSPGFFVDGILNTTKLDATFNGATLGLDLEGEAKSIGYRLEGGLRFDWGDGIWFEPLAALSYVRTDLGDMDVADGVTARFDRFDSLRGSLGARLSGDVEFEGFTLQLAGTGRVWNEFRGEANSRIATGFGDFAFTDANDGMISELGASLGLFGLGGRLSAQLSSGVKFASDYQSVDVALSARYQW